jgi:hypothetical protein
LVWAASSLAARSLTKVKVSVKAKIAAPNIVKKPKNRILDLRFALNNGFNILFFILLTVGVSKPAVIILQP